LRNNLTDGLRESLKLNQLNAPFLEMKEIKIFEIGTVFFKDKEEIHVAWNEKKEIKELTLEKFVAEKLSPEEHRNFLIEISESPRRRDSQGSSEETFPPQIFTPWSIYPFISRDVAVWIPEGESSETFKKILKENGTSLLVKDPYLFDSFTKPASTTGGDGKTSYAFRLVFQSYEKTLTDDEVNEIMNKINEKISENPNWQVR
jgi:phenylalanyl-tRNA synthetase beta subunit